MKDNEIIFKENRYISLASVAAIGDREEQQDCSGYYMDDMKTVAVVCDGMGGQNGGKTASNTAVSFVLENIISNKNTDYVGVLSETTYKADEIISDLRNENGDRLGGGSTMVTVIIENNEMYWSSVGDSRLYILRGDDFIRVTTDHNYIEYLKEKLSESEITYEEFEEEKCRGEALISYLGIGDLQLVDHNIKPLMLEKDDRIIIMTDGLYKVLNDEEIRSLIKNFVNVREAVEAIDKRVKKVAKKKNLVRDNMTFVVMGIH